MHTRFGMWSLLLAVAALALLPLLASTQAQVSSSLGSTVTENVRLTRFSNSTSTATIIQVICLSTATSQLNLTRTVTTYTSVETVFVMKVTVTVTMPATVSYVKSSTTVDRCQGFKENPVATRTVALPFVLYVESQRSTQTSSLLRSVDATAVSIAFLLAVSCIAALLVHLAWISAKAKSKTAP